MSNPSKTLAEAARRILKPLVRVLLRNGVACGAMEEIVRQVYVDVAFDKAGSDGRRATVSSVSAATGLSRKEVKRLKESPRDTDPADQRYNRAIRVISGWLNDDRFAYSEGSPRPLLLAEGPEQDGATFAMLVKAYSGDIPTRAMLDLLASSGCIETTDGRVNLVRHAYVPGADSEEIIRILGKDTSELMNTIDHNLASRPEQRWYQRKVSNTRVDPQAVETFRRYAGRRSQQLLEELDNWLSEHEATGTEDGEYVSLGIYYFQESRNEEDPS